MDTVRDKIKASTKAFTSHVWPKVTSCLGGGRVVSIEGSGDTDYFAQLLDTYSGIDILHVDDSRSLLRGLATRNQQTKRLFHTLTVRFSRPNGCEVEFHKRLRTINEPNAGWMFPALAIHSYFTPGYHTLRATAIAPMREIIRIITEGEQGTGWNDARDFYLDHTSAKWGNSDNTTFAVIPISTFRRWNIKHKWMVFDDQ